MDGIVVDFVSSWCQKYNEITGESLKNDDKIGWDIADVAKYPEVLYDLIDLPDAFFDPEPFPDAIKYIKQLQKDGLEIVFLTTAPSTADFAVRDKRRWIEKYLPDFNIKNVIYCHRKDLVNGDILIDDRPKNVEAWRRSHADGLTAAILYSPKANNPPKVDWLFENPETAWAEIYEKITEHNKAYSPSADYYW